MAGPPLFVGGEKVTVACVLPAVAAPMIGAPGGLTTTASAENQLVPLGNVVLVAVAVMVSPAAPENGNTALHGVEQDIGGVPGTVGVEPSNTRPPRLLAPSEGRFEKNSRSKVTPSTLSNVPLMVMWPELRIANVMTGKF